jgi:hypothetical protein
VYESLSTGSILSERDRVVLLYLIWSSRVRTTKFYSTKEEKASLLIYKYNLYEPEEANNIMWEGQNTIDGYYFYQPEEANNTVCVEDNMVDGYCSLEVK